MSNNYTIQKTPKSYRLTLAVGATWNLAADAPLGYLSIETLGSEDISVRFNGDDETAFQLLGNSSITFSGDEVHITSVQLRNSWTSGWSQSVESGAASANVQVLCSYTGDTKPTVG